MAGEELLELMVSSLPLEDVHRVAQLVALNLVSIGASLARVHVPGRSEREASDTLLRAGEIEIGMGIHNEPGSERVRKELSDLVKIMLLRLLDQCDTDRSFLQITAEDQVVLLINNLGGISVLELGGITNEVVTQLKNEWSIKPVRILSGTFMTSLNALGFSISILRLADIGLGGELTMLELLDTPTDAIAWPRTLPLAPRPEKSDGPNLSLPPKHSDPINSTSVKSQYSNHFNCAAR
jgi:triose/dihydroxyacetone kinase / FAD-AMP lyase (cyclizing)